MKTSIRWGAVCFFGLMLAMAACGSDDAEPSPGNQGGSGGEGGHVDHDAGDGPDAADDADSRDEPDADASDDTDGATEGGNGQDDCQACLEDPNKCGDALDACNSIQACNDAFAAVFECMDQAKGDDKAACVEEFKANGGQEAQDLLDCIQTECSSECKS